MLPPEVTRSVCDHLSPSSLTALEVTCTRLRDSLEAGGVWRRAAEQVNTRDSLELVTAMLDFMKENTIGDRRVFKVVLGAHQLVSRTLAGLDQLAGAPVFTPETGDGVFASAAKRKVKMWREGKVRQVRAWSRRLLRRLGEERDEGEYNVREEHEEMFQRILLGEDEVMTSLEELTSLTEPQSLGQRSDELCCTMCKILGVTGLQGREAIILIAAMCYCGVAHGWESVCNHCSGPQNQAEVVGGTLGQRATQGARSSGSAGTEPIECE